MLRRISFIFLLLVMFFANSPAAAISYAPNGTTGLSLVYNGNVDDTFFTVNLPWSISFLGSNYSTVYVGSNGYITFASGSSTYSGFSASNPPGPHISIIPADRRLYKLYYAQIGTGTAEAKFVIRVEGVDYSNSGVTHIYEVHFYPSQSYFDIFVVDAPSSGNAGTAGISNGSAYVSTYTIAEESGIRINSVGTIYVDAPQYSSSITNAQQTRKTNLTTNRNSVSGNSIYVDQVGDNNTIAITQTGYNNSIQGINQQRAKLYGNSNNITIKQGNSSDSLGKNLIKLEINTGSNSNTVNLLQGYLVNGTMNASDSDGHIISLGLTGSSNQVNLYQTNDGGSNSGHFAEMNITGSGNNITVNQKNNSTKTFFGSVTGSSNTVSATQQGTGTDFLDLTLTGNGHNVTTNQQGSGNHAATLDLTNAGGSSTVTMTQQGSTAQTYSLQQSCANPAGCSTSITQP